MSPKTGGCGSLGRVFVSESLARSQIEASANRRVSGWWSWLAVVAIIVLAAIIYRPWQPIPLPVIDWGGMLPVLTEQPTIPARFHGLTEMHTREGRYQPAFMAAIAITWSAFGANTVGWQWIRFAVMTGIIIACIALARRLGASIGGATAAALLLVLSGMAQQSWVVPQVPEPRGALVLVCAALIAVGYGTSGHWRARAAAIVSLLVISILYKETFIVAVPFVLALALWARKGGQWIVRRPTARDFVLVAGVALAIGVVNVVPILSVRELAEAQAYGARYDISSVSVGRLRNVLSAVFLPVTRVWWFPANIVFLAAVTVGVVLGVRRHGRSTAVAVGVLLSLPLAGVIIYLPWYAMEGFYALAYLPALIALFALALTWLWQSEARMAKALGVAACSLLAAYGMLLSTNYINAYRASRVVEAGAARALAGLEGRRLIAGVPSPANSGSFAAGLRGYAQAAGVSDVPPGVDVACPDAFTRVMQREPEVVVVFSTLCDPAGAPHITPARVILQSYVMRDWKTFARSRNEVSVRIWAVATPAEGIKDE